MESLLLVSTSDPRRIAIQPISNQGKKAAYVLILENLAGRAGGNINCTARFQPAASFDASSYSQLVRQPVKGCVGLVQVENEPFIGVISESTVVGSVEGSTIYQVNNVLFFSLTSDTYDNFVENGASYVQKRDMAYQMNSLDGASDQYETLRHPCREIQRFLSTGNFYFSYDFDLTRCAQVRYQSKEQGSLWDTTDDRFFWNRHMIKELLKFRRQLPESEQKLLDNEGILVMCINGFVRIEERGYKTALISRLSCKRAGTRFNTRGIDDDGNVANNVESELLFYAQDFCYSYIINRGSVPLFWEQQGIQLANHKIQISRSSAATQPAVERHFRDLIEHYGKQHVVNLLSQKEGAELQLTEAFSSHVRDLKMPDSVKMTSFDFHAAVKGNQFENLGALMSELRDSLKDFGFFLINTKTKVVVLKQSGAFRVNCLDCLDRTNVVEGLICKSSLSNFLVNIKMTPETIFNACLNDMWADNGDEISRIYTGTGALKSGFTRTGKRTLAGFMDDAKKSATRFIQNNFQDKYKQEVIDTILGKLANQAPIRLHNPIREAVLTALNERKSEFCSLKKIKVHVGTWNVNGKQPSGEPLENWLGFKEYSEPPQMIVVGFQEIVELSPQQIMATDNTKRMVWEEILLKSLNSRGNGSYVILKSGQLVGAALCIFARSEMVQYIRNVEGAIKKTGLAGLAGNKGGIAIRMDIFDTNLCFICAHLAAGQNAVDERNRDYETISEGLTFNKGRKLIDHDNVIWLGDFNYRIDMVNEEVRQCVRRGDLEHLYQEDQLQKQIARGLAFGGFSEGHITFAPTYKYDNGTDNYDTSEKQRVPAWTDRILYEGEAIKQLKYSRAELRSSDHKPVKSLFEIEIQIINNEVRDKIQTELYRKYLAAGAPTQTVETRSRNDNTNRPLPLPPKSNDNILINFDDNFTANAPPVVTARSTPAPNASANQGQWGGQMTNLVNSFQGMMGSFSQQNPTPQQPNQNFAMSSFKKESPPVPRKPEALAAAALPNAQGHFINPPSTGIFPQMNVQQQNFGMQYQQQQPNQFFAQAAAQAVPPLPNRPSTSHTETDLFAMAPKLTAPPSNLGRNTSAISVPSPNMSNYHVGHQTAGNQGLHHRGRPPVPIMSPPDSGQRTPQQFQQQQQPQQQQRAQQQNIQNPFADPITHFNGGWNTMTK